MAEEKQYGLTALEVAERLGVTDDTVYRRAAAGELPHYRVGSAVRFDWPEVRAATHVGAREPERETA